MARMSLLLSLLGVTALSACDDPDIPHFALVDRAALITAPYMNERLQLQAKVIHDPIRPFAIGLNLQINGQRAVDQTKRIIVGSKVFFDGSWQGQQIQVQMTRDIQFIRTFYELDIYIDGNLVHRIEV